MKTHTQCVARIRAIEQELTQLDAKDHLSRSEGLRAHALGIEADECNERRKTLEKAGDIVGGTQRGRYKTEGEDDTVAGHADERDRDDHPHTGVRDSTQRLLDRSVSSGQLPARSAETVESLCRTGTGGDQSWTQRMVEALGDDAYMRAFSKLIGDPAHGHLLWGKDEHAAFQRVEQLRSETRAMSTTDAAGGYMSPLFIDPSIMLSSSGSNNPLRQISRVVQTISDTWNGLTSAGVTFEWLAEAAQAADASPTLAQPSIPVYKIGGFVSWSYEIGMDAVNFMPELSKLMADGYDQLTAAAFTTGTGTGQPTGIVTGLVGSGSVVNTIGTEVVASGDIYALQNALPPRFQANASWCASLPILNILRQMETAAGALKFPGLQNNPPMLLGREAHELSNMDSTLTAAQENYTVLYGAFENFVIVDRWPVQFELIPNLVGANGRPTGQRGAFMWARVGSDSVIDGAFRMLDAT
jgi:HK97 family phage major capsid protein